MKSKNKTKMFRISQNTDTIMINLRMDDIDSILSKFEKTQQKQNNEEKRMRKQQKSNKKIKNIKIPVRNVHISWSGTENNGKMIDVVFQKVFELKAAHIAVQDFGYTPVPSRLPDDTSTTALEFDYLKLSEGMVSQMKRGLDNYMIENDTKCCTITEIFVMDCVFMDRSANDLAKLFWSDSLPSLRTLTINCRRTMTNQNLAKFLKTILSVKKQSRPSSSSTGTATTTTTGQSDPSRIAGDDSEAASSVKKLNISIDGKKHASKIMSVVTQWLLLGTTTKYTSGNNDNSDDTNSTLQQNQSAKAQEKGEEKECNDLMVKHIRKVFQHFGDEFINSSSKLRLERVELLFGPSNTDHQTTMTTQWSNGQDCYQPKRDGTTENNCRRVINLTEYNSIQYNSLSFTNLLDCLLAVRHFLAALNLENCFITDENLTKLSNQLLPQSPNLTSLRWRYRHHHHQQHSPSHGRHQSAFSQDCITNALLPGIEKSPRLYDVDMDITGNETYKKIQYVCDINRGGKCFLLKSSSPKGKQRRYPAALWSLIFHRIIHSMTFRLSMSEMNHDADTIQNIRRHQVIYYLLIHGALIDCAASRCQPVSVESEPPRKRRRT